MARTRHHTLCGSPNGRPTHKYKTVFPYRYHHGSQAGFTSHVDRKRETILRSISQAISKSDSVLGFHLTATSPPPTGSLDEIRAHNWRTVSPAKYRLGSPTRAARNGNHKINSVSHVISQARSKPNLILAFHLTATSPPPTGSLDEILAHNWKPVSPSKYHLESPARITSKVDRKRETVLRSISQAISKSDSVLGFHLTATSPPPTGSLDEIRAHNWRTVSPAKYRLGSPTRAARNGNHKINSVSHVISQARSEPNLILAFHLTATSPATSPQLSGSLDGGLSCDCRGAVLHLDFGLSDPSSISESVSEDECASCNTAWSLLLPPGHMSCSNFL